MTELQEKVHSLYELIGDRFYLGDELFEIGDRKYVPIVLFDILNLLLDGKEIVFGEYGSGKTSSSERISSLVKGLPLEFIQSTTIHAHPEQTEEKMKATLDLGALEKEGRELVRWKIIPFSPVVIIDEINRLPVGKQNMLLNEVDRNIWSYRGETLILQSGKTFFATVNYQDIGATKVIAPLLDRFDLGVETASSHPVRKRIIRRGIDEEILQDRDLSENLIQYIMHNNDTGSAAEVTAYLKLRAEEFKEKLEIRFRGEGIALGIPRSEEVEIIRHEINAMMLAEDAELFLDYVGQEIACHYSLKKEFSRCDGCHYQNYLCSDLYSISNRAEQSLLRYAKALAWMTCESEVTLEHITAIMPFVIWHRTGISDKKRGEVREVEKDSSDDWYAVADALRQGKKRWEEHKDYQVEAYVALQRDDAATLAKLSREIGHPFFKSLVRGLA
ncbi:MAG: AAA family ATPase [Syntrophobacteria bacterium]